MYIQFQQIKPKLKIEANQLSGNKYKLVYKEGHGRNDTKSVTKPYTVLFNSTQMKNSTMIKFSYPIPMEISSYMILQSFIPNLNKIIDERSRKQALIVS